MIKNYRTGYKTDLLLRVIAGLCLMIGIVFFALSTPFLILAIAFIGLAFCFLAILH
jgi:hypothetical protein